MLLWLTLQWRTRSPLSLLAQLAHKQSLEGLEMGSAKAMTRCGGDGAAETLLPVRDVISSSVWGRPSHGLHPLMIPGLGRRHMGAKVTLNNELVEAEIWSHVSK